MLANALDPQLQQKNICRYYPLEHNAHLRGWQRITTKLKHSNRNHRGSMGLETLRVDSPA